MSQSSLDVTLANRPKSFQKTAGTTTGFSDYNKIIATFRPLHPHEPPQNIIYRNYKIVFLMINSLRSSKINTNKHASVEAEVSAQPSCIYDKETYTYS